MRTLLLALNAKYIHSNIAVRYLQKYAAPFLRQPPQILELTINNRLDFILDEIFRRSPDILLFSTYIWNVDMVRRLASEYRKLRPDALIGAGGPEVSYESEAFVAAESSLRPDRCRGAGERARSASYFGGTNLAPIGMYCPD